MTELNYLIEEFWFKKVAESGTGLSWERDLSTSQLQQIHSLRYFIRYANTPESYIWCETHGVLDELFSDSQPLSLAGQLVSWWVSAYFVLPHADMVFSTIKNKGNLSPPFCERIIQRLLHHDRQNEQIIVRQWVQILIEQKGIEAFDAQLLHLLGSVAEKREIQTTLILFNHLTRPKLVMLDPWKEMPEEFAVRFDLGPDFRDGMLEYTWNNALLPHLDSFAEGLVPILTNHLQSAHILRISSLRNNDTWNADLDDKYRRGIVGFLYNCAKEVLERLAQIKPNVSEAAIELWLNSSTPLLRKLGLHGLARTNFKKHKAVEKLLYHNLTFERYCAREVRELLKRHYDSATIRVKQGFRAAVREEWREQLYKHAQIDKESWLLVPLYELVKAILDSNAQDEKLENIRLRLERKYPDLPKLLESERQIASHMTSGAVSPSEFSVISSKMSPEEAIEKVQKTSDIERFASIRALTSIINDNFHWGIEASHYLINKEIWDKEIWGAVIYGFKDQPLDTGQWRSVFEILNAHASIVEHAQLSARLIADGSNERDGTITAELVDEVTSLALLLQGHADEADYANHPSQSGFISSLQTAGGQLAMFWVRWTSRAINADAELIGSKVTEFLSNLETLIVGTGISSHYSRIMTASQLPFLINRQREWTEQNMLGWFDWQNEDKAKEAWDGFLLINPIDINAVRPLMDFYGQTAANLGRFDREVRELFIRQIVVIQLFGQNYNLDVPIPWITDILEKLDESDRILFAWKIREPLSSMSEDELIEQWNGWFEDYWKKRISSSTGEISNKEAAAMLSWCILLKPFFKDVVELICKGPAPEVEYTSVFTDLKENDFITSEPESLLKLLAFIVERADEEFPKYHLGTIAEILDQLSQPDSYKEELKTICNHLSRLGYENSLELAFRLKVLEE